MEWCKYRLRCDSVGSKRTTTTAVAAAGGGSTAARSGPIQVIFGGKIVTPQSLVQKKSHSHHPSKHAPRPPVVRQLTIDESLSEAAEKTIGGPIGSRLNLKT